MMKTGDIVNTVYGPGQLKFYRETDGIYVVKLPYGELFAKRDVFCCGEEESKASAAAAVVMKKGEDNNNSNNSMKLNVAYEALEKMRKLNLEVKCQEMGLACDFDGCTACLLTTTMTTPQQQQQQQQHSASYNKKNSSLHHQKRFPRLARAAVNRLMEEKMKMKKVTPCLVCGAPTCHRHASCRFRKEAGICVCCDCEKLFTLDFVVDCLTADSGSKQRAEQIDRMVDIYDRTLLVLKYSSQFIDQISTHLEEKTAQQNKVGLGSSSAGIVSGALGIAAAATILTPAGPPLLIASLLFGGSATAVQTGTEAMNYFSEPNKLADRIIALHGMLESILRITGTLRDALLRDHLRVDDYEEKRCSPKEHVEEALQKHRGGLMAGLAASRYGLAGMEIGGLVQAAEVSTVAGRNARFFSRNASGLMRSARFARFAGGALSAATLLLEAKCMTTTIQSLRAGNPCEKADMLRRIKEELDSDVFSSTSSLERECHSYLETLTQRQRALTEEEVIQILLELSQEDAMETPILEGTDENVSPASGGEEPLDSSKKKENMSASLLERITVYKERENSSSVSDASSSSVASTPTSTWGTQKEKRPSLLERISAYKEREASFHDSESMDSSAGSLDRRKTRKGKPPLEVDAKLELSS